MKRKSCRSAQQKLHEYMIVFRRKKDRYNYNIQIFVQYVKQIIPVT